MDTEAFPDGRRNEMNSVPSDRATDRFSRKIWRRLRHADGVSLHPDVFIAYVFIAFFDVTFYTLGDALFPPTTAASGRLEVDKWDFTPCFGKIEKRRAGFETRFPIRKVESEKIAIATSRDIWRIAAREAAKARRDWLRNYYRS